MSGSETGGTASESGESAEESIVQRAVESVTRDFTTITWVMIPIAIGLNTVGGVFARFLRLPLFLDNLGTSLVAIMAGPWAAALTGLLSNSFDAITTDPVAAAFIPVPVALGILTGYLARYGYFETLPKVILSAILATAITVITSAPIVVVVFGGATGAGADLVTAAFLGAGQSIWTSVVSGQILVNIVDKGGLTILAWLIAMQVPARYQPPLGQKIFTD